MHDAREWDESCPREYDRWEARGATWLVQDLPPEDDDLAVQILRDHMIKDETMSSSCGLPDDPESVEGLLEFWRKSLSARTSLACYEVRDGVQKLVGLNVCVVKHKGDEIPEDEIKGEKCWNILKTLLYIESKCDVFAYLGEDTLLEAVGLCIHTDYRGCGLGGRVLAAREPLCKLLGVRGTATLFTGPASQKLAARCGFTSVAAVGLAELAAAGLQYPPGDPRVILYMNCLHVDGNKWGVVSNEMASGTSNYYKDKGNIAMDPLVKYIVYNRTPQSRDLDYDAIKSEKLKNQCPPSDRRTLLLSPELGTLIEDRILYARNKVLGGARPGLVGGTPIHEQLAVELRMTCFGSSACPTRGEWLRTALTMRAPDQPLAFGLLAARNNARALLSALQALLIKWLLFDSRPVTKDNKSYEHPDIYLRPSEERQEEALWHALSEVVWRCGGGTGGGSGVGTTAAGVEPRAIVALPSDITYVQHSSGYYQDGVTEKFQSEEGCGALLLLYSAVLSRGCENVMKDLDGKLSCLVSGAVEGSLNVVTLLLTGRATPYLHNGVLYVGDEDHYALPQFGILSRSPVGLLVWYGQEDGQKRTNSSQSPGSRLKTPALPIWVTSCSGHYGVLFNTNRELLRNYHAERRFDIQYYTCGGCHVVLNVDTRAHDDVGVRAADDISATPLEKLIHTKWQDAKITWTGAPPPQESDK